MDDNTILALLFFPAVATVLVFFMRYVSAVLQARVRLGQDEAYRALATQTSSSQTEMAASLAAFGSTIAEISARLGRIEKILNDVA